jgi:hypothetical protein
LVSVKSVEEWSLSYIQDLPLGEHDWIELKGTQLLDFTLSGVDKNNVLGELAKQLSAFANSGGGTIVYGLKDDTREVDCGGVSLSVKGNATTKEWLEDKIPNLVEFPLSRFNVYVITDELGIKPGKGIFLISVEDSPEAPHQAVNDRKYYARIGGKSKPISHRMVMDIAGRAKHPNIELDFKFEPIKEILTEQYLNLCLTYSNTGKIYCKYLNCYIKIPIDFLHNASKNRMDDFAGTIKEIDGLKYMRFSVENIHRDMVGMHGIMPHTRPLTISRYDPILPGTGRVETIGLLIKGKSIISYRATEILWELYADNAPMKNGKIKIIDIPIENQ